MSVVTIAELEAHLGVLDTGDYQQLLDKAEGAVASAIGAETLDQSTGVVDYITPAQPSYTLRIEGDGPLFVIEECVESFGGTVFAPSNFKEHPWRADYVDPAAVSTIPFLFGQILKLTYTHGYADSSEMPPGMALAVLNAAEWIQSKPSGSFESESIGDWSYKVLSGANLADQTLPADSIDKLRLLTRPDYAW